MFPKKDLNKLILFLAVCLFYSNVSLAKDSIRGKYFVLDKIPAKNSITKVIYEEFINFGCSHCNNLHKASKNFRKEFSDKVKFVDIPILFRGQNDAPLRLYYVAKKIGKGDLIKDELFKANFEHGVNVFDPGIVNFLSRSLGISKTFQREKNQNWVNKLIENGKRKAAKYGVTGTPTVVLQQAIKMDIGRYGTMSDFIKKVPETIKDLRH